MTMRALFAVGVRHTCADGVTYYIDGATGICPDCGKPYTETDAEREDRRNRETRASQSMADETAYLERLYTGTTERTP